MGVDRLDILGIHDERCSVRAGGGCADIQLPNRDCRIAFCELVRTFQIKPFLVGRKLRSLAFLREQKALLLSRTVLSRRWNPVLRQQPDLSAL